MSRFNQILVVILVIQLALTAFMVWPRSATQAAAGPLLADFPAGEASQLVVQDGDGNRLVLAKDDGQWVLPEADNFPADGEKIKPLLEKLAGVQTNRLVTQTEASHKRLKVAEDEFNRLLVITSPGGNIQKLYIGSSAGAGATHIRLAGRPEVYLTNQITGYEVTAQPASWIDTLYYTIPQTATTALTLENQNGTFEFEKDGDKWTMKGLADDETLKESAVTGLLNQAVSVRMTAPLGKEEKPAYGLDEPLAVVTLKTQAGEVYTLRVGAKDEANHYLYTVSYSESPYYVRVTEFVGNNFVEKTRDDFLEPPPTPETEETVFPGEQDASDLGDEEVGD